MPSEPERELSVSAVLGTLKEEQQNEDDTMGFHVGFDPGPLVARRRRRRIRSSQETMRVVRAHANHTTGFQVFFLKK